MINTKLEKNMAEMFDIELEEEKPKEEIQELALEGEKIDLDFEKTRKNLEELLETGKEALSFAMAVAKQSDDPKAYQVVSNMMAQISDINEQLLELHLKHQKHKNNDYWKKNSQKTESNQIPTINDSAKQITNNAIFVGTPAELSKIIKGQLGDNDNAITHKE